MQKSIKRRSTTKRRSNIKRLSTTKRRSNIKRLSTTKRRSNIKESRSKNLAPNAGRIHWRYKIINGVNAQTVPSGKIKYKGDMYRSVQYGQLANPKYYWFKRK